MEGEEEEGGSVTAGEEGERSSVMEGRKKEAVPWEEDTEDKMGK